MIRPTPTSRALVSAVPFALLSLAASTALAEASDATAAPATAKAATAETTAPATVAPATVAPATVAPATTAPATTAPATTAPPMLEPLEVPPAFNAEEAGGFLWSFLKSMLMLGVVLALIYLVLHKGLGRLMQRTQMGRRMRVVERIALDQRRALYLVEVDGQEVLLAASDGAVAAVELPSSRAAKEREPPATPASPAVRFSTDLGKTGRAPPQTGVDVDGKSGDDNGRGASKVQTAKAREGVEG